MTLKFAVGDLTIHRIIEQETSFLPALDMLPGLTPERLAENRAWMRQASALDADDVLILCFQAYIVKTPHHTILVDSCIGNDKPRPLRPKWNMKTDDTYMRGLAAAGFSLSDIDYVMCTHLHTDHVGWNTRLEDGRWVPTFPRAKYIFSRTEYDHLMKLHQSNPELPVNRGSFVDSVLPVVEHGQARFVEMDHSFEHELGENVWLTPAAGHTAGHVLIHVGHEHGEHAVMTGDV